MANWKCVSFHCSLPEAYWDGLNSLLTSTLSSEPLSQWNLPMDPFTVFRVAHGTNNLDEPAEPVSLLLALAHSVFHHAGIAQVSYRLPRKLTPPLMRVHFPTAPNVARVGSWEISSNREDRRATYLCFKPNRTVPATTPQWEMYETSLWSRSAILSVSLVSLVCACNDVQNI